MDKSSGSTKEMSGTRPKLKNSQHKCFYPTKDGDKCHSQRNKYHIMAKSTNLSGCSEQIIVNVNSYWPQAVFSMHFDSITCLSVTTYVYIIHVHYPNYKNIISA